MFDPRQFQVKRQFSDFAALLDVEPSNAEFQNGWATYVRAVDQATIASIVTRTDLQRFWDRQPPSEFRERVLDLLWEGIFSILCNYWPSAT